MLNAENLSMVLGAAISLAIVLLLIWFLLKWMGNRQLPMQSSGKRQIQVLDRAIIAPDKCLVLVRVAEKTILVGMSSHAVEKISEIEDPEGLLDQPMEAKKNLFSAILQNRMGSGADQKGESD